MLIRPDQTRRSRIGAPLTRNGKLLLTILRTSVAVELRARTQPHHKTGGRLDFQRCVPPFRRAVQFLSSNGISRSTPWFIGTAIKFGLSCEPLASSMRRRFLEKPEPLTPSRLPQSFTPQPNL